MLQDAGNPFSKVMTPHIFTEVYGMSYLFATYIVGESPSSCAETATVRHKDCYLLLPPDSTCVRCAMCIQQRRSLQIQAKRMESEISRTAPSSHTNYRYLTRTELIVRLSGEHHQRQLISKQCQRLKARIEEVSEKAGVSVDPETHDGLKEIMVTNNSILQSLPPNTFQVSWCVL